MINKATKILGKGQIEGSPTIPSGESPKTSTQFTARIWHKISTIGPRIRKALQGPELTPPIVELEKETSHLLDDIFSRIVDEHHATIDLGKLNGRRIAYDHFQHYLREHYSGEAEHDQVVWENFRKHLSALHLSRNNSAVNTSTPYTLSRLALADLPNAQYIVAASEVLPYKNADAILEAIFSLQHIVNWENIDALDEQKIGFKRLVYTILVLIDDGKEKTVLNTLKTNKNTIKTAKDFTDIAFKLEQI